MEKRVLLFLVLSAAVFVLYFGFFNRPNPPLPIKSPVPGNIPANPNVVSASPSGTGTPSLPSESRPAVPAAAEVRTSLSNSLINSDISSWSGLPVKWALKKYFVQPNRQGSNIDLLQNIGGSLPLGLLLLRGQPAIYPNFRLVEQNDHSQRYEGQSGHLAIQETLEFGSTDYTLQLRLVVENKGEEPQTLSPGLHLEVEQSPPARRGFLIFKEAPNFKFPVYRMGTKVKRLPNVDKLGAYQEEEGDLSWTGLEDHYFLRMMLARNVSTQNRVAYGRDGTKVFTELQYAPEALAVGQQREFLFTLYLGPKEPSLLSHFGEAHLEQAIDYGWFGVIAYPILWTLKIFYSFLKNWGLAIIALTVLIKLILYPLTRASMKSMKSMQALQPQLQKLREKHQNDREKLNLETMNLFRQHKVNPMGGCLPMLIQMPIYIALYKVLYNATDLYHAPFFGFYHDLSAPDPYYILPILLGVFMLLQQKMTPSSTDPAQAKMMMIMPLMFSLFMFFLPLGLVLYIFVNTVLTVIQQWMNQKNIGFRDLLVGGRSST